MLARLRRRHDLLAKSLCGLLLALSSCKRAPPPGAGQSDPVPSAAPAPPPKPIASASAAPPSSAEAPVLERPPLPEPEKPPPLATALAAHPPGPGASPHAGFRGPVDRSKDRAWIERLSSESITEIKRNPGGATITLRVKFADGQRAVFKPEQRRGGASARAEIAAYHLDRIVGFGRTAVVVGRSIGLAHLRQHLEHTDADRAFLERFDKEIVASDGKVAGALVAWHAGKLASAAPPPKWTAGLRGDAGVDPEIARRLPEWSDMMVFDHVIDNTDRWSGGNILSLGDGGPLIFLDNAAAFSRGKGASPAKIEPLCRFREATIRALEARGPESAPNKRLSAELKASLARDPVAPVLSEAQLGAVDLRVTSLLEHVERCIGELTEPTVLSL